MNKNPFGKFANKKKNSVVKEAYRQEKKKARKEKNEYFEKKKKDEYAARQAKRNGPVAAKEIKAPPSKSVNKKEVSEKAAVTQEMPLNKYLAHCGVASRRETIEHIKNGLVKVNAEVCTNPAYKVEDKDEVFYNGKKCFITKNLVYVLLNKPKDFITTTNDPQGRKTVLQLIQKATTERIYPIGRLDRNTSGVLLFTNDGDLTQKLSHPSFEIKKIYEVKLDKNLTKAHFDDILNDLVLEDGPVHVDSLAYADSKDKSVIGIEIHSGRNRIVRRIFESLGYDVKGLDRVMFAGLTKKNVERGKWRFLNEKEIRLLKYMNASKGKKAKITKAEKDDALALEKTAPVPFKTKKPIVKKENKVPAQPRKFKTHKEKKEFLQKNEGRK